MAEYPDQWRDIAVAAESQLRREEQTSNELLDLLAKRQLEITWRKQAMSDAKDALACGDTAVAWCALNRHEDGHRCFNCNAWGDGSLPDFRAVYDDLR